MTKKKIFNFTRKFLRPHSGENKKKKMNGIYLKKVNYVKNQATANLYAIHLCVSENGLDSKINETTAKLATRVNCIIF